MRHVDPGLLDYCTTDKQRNLVQSVIDKGGLIQGAAAVGMDTSNASKMLILLESKAARLGFAPGHWEDGVAPGYLMGKVTVQRGPGGVERVWERQHPDADHLESIRQAIDSFLAGRDPLKAPEAPKKCDKDIIPWYEIGDGHFGMVAHELEVGHNFDLKIAYQEIASAFSILFQEAQPTERCVINDLGDFTHYENMAGATEASGHLMDRDGRFPKMIDLYADLMGFIVDEALKKHQHVDIIINQGNHSRTNDIWMAKTLKMAYGHTGRVHVLNNHSVFIPYRMGNTFVMTHHSDKTRKPADLVSVMSNDFRHDWGETEYHYIDVGHLHHKITSIEKGGAVFEMWNTLAPMDKYAHDYGFRSKQSITVVYRSKSYGEVGRRVLPIAEIRNRLLKAATKSDYVVPDRREVFTV